MVHIYNEILPSHEKERYWAIGRDVDGPRICHTEWSKSEREKQISHAIAAAKSLQSCPTLCDPIDSSPPRLLCPWDPPGYNTGVGCHFLLQ